MTTPPPLPPRHVVLRMVLAVIALDVVFVVVYAASGLRSAAGSTRAVFTALWTLLTVLVLGYGLNELRKARRANRR